MYVCSCWYMCVRCHFWYVLVCICVYTHMSIYTHACIHTYMYVYMYVCMHAQTCLFAHIHAYTHTYIHTYRSAQSSKDLEKTSPYIHTCIHTYIQERTVIKRLGENLATGTAITGQTKIHLAGKSDRAYHLATTSDAPTIQVRRSFICVCICLCVCIHTYVCVYPCCVMCIWLLSLMHRLHKCEGCLFVCVFVCVCIHTYVCVCVCIRVVLCVFGYYL